MAMCNLHARKWFHSPRINTPQPRDGILTGEDALCCLRLRLQHLLIVLRRPELLCPPLPVLDRAGKAAQHAGEPSTLDVASS
eukprot:7626871-Alexandrium_andersonii.AAC.1